MPRWKGAASPRMYASSSHPIWLSVAVRFARRWTAAEMSGGVQPEMLGTGRMSAAMDDRATCWTSVGSVSVLIASAAASSGNGMAASHAYVPSESMANCAGFRRCACQHMRTGSGGSSAGVRGA